MGFRFHRLIHGTAIMGIFGCSESDSTGESSDPEDSGGAPPLGAGGSGLAATGGSYSSGQPIGADARRSARSLGVLLLHDSIACFCCR
jgi:hypothetical protein